MFMPYHRPIRLRDF